MEKKDAAVTFFKGFCVGGTMLVPGVSGGSMAMILNIYDRLITAVSSFMKHKRKSLVFLGVFSIGALLGMMLFARPLLALIERYPLPLMYFFIGAVAGSVPMIYKKAKGRGFTWKSIVYPLLGFLSVIALSMMPKDLFQNAMEPSLFSITMLFVAGLIAAIALVLPGISLSYMLLLLGMYDETMRAISELYMPYLLPLGIGTMVGILLTTKLLEKAMNRYPQPTYLIILGFILGSVGEVFPGVPSRGTSVICCITLLLGFWIVKRISRSAVLQR